jgi:MYXO-CTERM domain-containing protein
MAAPTKLAAGACLLAAAFSPRAAGAATVHVTPTDSFDVIEKAKPGDEVVIAPGTYKFRVYLTAAAPADNPIIIRGEDPQNPPVWDLTAGHVEDAAGSYKAGDRGRGCWQISGGTNIHISDIVITNCHAGDADSAGMRYYNGAKGITLSNVVFRHSDNGLTGGTQDSEITVEHCEFDQNGTLLAPTSGPSHNIYIYGGTFALRYSYVHDPVQAQNFHIRAKESTLEYNWFSRAKSYAGDLMLDDDYDGKSTFTQTMTFRGNVIVQGDTQSNDGQIIAMYNDGGADGLTLNVKLLYNTIVGNGGHAALVHLSNADAKTTMNAELDDNLIFGTTKPTLIENATLGKVTGQHNWLMTGADASGLSGSVTGADPMFNAPAKNDFTLKAGSSAIGAALDTVSGRPDREYYKDEASTRMYRLRASAKDIGAFESTTMGAGIGFHNAAPDSGVPGMMGSGGSGGVNGVGGTGGAGGNVSATTGGSSGSAMGSGAGGGAGAESASAASASESSGCGCRVVATERRMSGWLFALAGLFAVHRRRRRK